MLVAFPLHRVSLTYHFSSSSTTIQLRKSENCRSFPVIRLVSKTNNQNKFLLHILLFSPPLLCSLQHKRSFHHLNLYFLYQLHRHHLHQFPLRQWRILASVSAPFLGSKQAVSPPIFAVVPPSLPLPAHSLHPLSQAASHCAC